jgi:predicted SnoaL-like aldol condensation-catalyzing enzyme
VARTPGEQANLDRVLAMYREVLIPMNPDKVEKHLSARYVQHSSLAEPGLDALKRFLKQVRRPGDPGLAVIDIFRCEADEIVEHWDVIQDVPAESINPNGMF